MREECRLLSWGSFFLFFLVIDLLVMHGKEEKNDHHRRRKSQRGISEGESPPYMRGRRIPSVVVGVVVVLRLTVERGVGMERQNLSYGEGVHTRFTSSGPSRRK